MKSAIRILVADDHPISRDGIALALSNIDEFEIIAELSNGQEALEAIRNKNIDVAILDVEMPVMSGMDVVNAVKEEGLDCRLIFMSMHSQPSLVRRAVKEGISGYVLKDSATSEVVTAVRTVANGDIYFSPRIASILVNQVREEPEESNDDNVLKTLTAAERRILKLIATDMTSKEIALKLGLSVRTIEGHRARITKKLGLYGAHSLVKFAFKYGSQL